MVAALIERRKVIFRDSEQFFVTNNGNKLSAEAFSMVLDTLCRYAGCGPKFSSAHSGRMGLTTMAVSSHMMLENGLKGLRTRRDLPVIGTMIKDVGDDGDTSQSQTAPSQGRFRYGRWPEEELDRPHSAADTSGTPRQARPCRRSSEHVPHGNASTVSGRTEKCKR